MSLFGSGRREGLLAVLTLLLMSIALHAPGLFLGMPRGPASELRTGEPTREAFTNQDTLLPAMRAAGNVIENDELPLWNSKSRFGESFLISGAPVLYPPFWLLMLHGGANILDLLLCLHTFLACMCMFRFCRAITISRYVAFLAGALYGLGWFFTAQLDRLPDAAAAALLPLALELTWRVLTTHRRAICGGLLSVVVALLFATGGTGIALLSIGVCFGMFFHGLWALDHENQWRALRTLGVTVGLSVMLTAPIWIHQLVHAPLLQEATSASTPRLQIAGLVGTLSPTAFGGLTGATTPALQMVNPDADPLELVLFPGTIVLFLGLLGLLLPKRTSLGLFWITIGGIGLVLSIDGPVAEAFYAIVPANLSRPGIALLLVHLAFVVLAAAALERFFESPVKRSFAAPITSIVTLALCAAVLVVGFVYPSWGRAIVAELVSGTPDEVTAALAHLRIALLPTVVFAVLIAALFLCWRRLGILRFKLGLEVLVVADLLVVAVMHTPRLDRVPGESHLTARIPEQSGRAVLVESNPEVNPTPLLQAGIPTITSTTTAILSRTVDLIGAINPYAVLVDHKARVLPLQSSRLVRTDLLDIAGVGIVLTGTPQYFDGFASIAPTPTVENHLIDTGYVHYRIEPPRRARICFRTIRADSRADAFDSVSAHVDRLAETVVLEGSDPGFACRPSDQKPVVEIVHDGANLVRLRVDVGNGSGYLVLADAYAPGWEATLDGEPVQIHPANIAMRAVEIPPGEHVVVFRYSPWLITLGLPISAFGLVLLFGWFCWPRRRR